MKENDPLTKLIKTSLKSLVPRGKGSAFISNTNKRNQQKKQIVFNTSKFGPCELCPLCNMDIRTNSYETKKL